MSKIQQIVEKIINQWDPIELFPFAPKDEYKDEIALIVTLIKYTRNKTEVAGEIQNIFSKNFGEPEFGNKRYKESIEIAEKILEEIKNMEVEK